MKLFYRRLYFLRLQPIKLNEYFCSIEIGYHITFHAIECAVTTCPGYGESCHRWPSLIKWSVTTIVLRFQEIRYCWILARGSLKTLAYHSLHKYWMQKIQKSWNKMLQLASVYPIFYLFIYSVNLLIYLK